VLEKVRTALANRECHNGVPTCEHLLYQSRSAKARSMSGLCFCLKNTLAHRSVPAALSCRKHTTWRSLPLPPARWPIARKPPSRSSIRCYRVQARTWRRSMPAMRSLSYKCDCFLRRLLAAEHPLQARFRYVVGPYRRTPCNCIRYNIPPTPRRRPRFAAET